MNLLSDLPSCILEGLNVAPIILADVGASANPPPTWRQMASFSCYLGFEPDARDRSDRNEFAFQKFYMVDKAVSDKPDGEVQFYLTASPYCSSVLKPNADVLRHYSFTELFDVESTATAPATTLSNCLQQLALRGIDWLKLDSQGKDLDIILSLDDEHRDALLAVDIEPGVEAFYEDENLFAKAHIQLQQEGFWLAQLKAHEYPRVEKATRDALFDSGVDFAKLPGCPTAIEGSYLRTLESFERTNPAADDFLRFWMIALASGQIGFALDVARSAQISASAVADTLLQHSIALAKSHAAGPPKLRNSFLKSIVPPILHPMAHRVAKAIRGS